MYFGLRSINPVVGLGPVVFCSVCGRLVSNMRFVFFPVATICLAAQSIPIGVAPLLSKFRTLLDDAGGAGQGVVGALTREAATELANNVVHDRRVRLLADAAAAAATRDVSMLKYTGACARTFVGCPVGWSPGAMGDCLPPASYDGPCGVTDLSEYSDAQKEEFALHCRAAWPCMDCTTDFRGCPSGWDAAGRLCVAPSEYDGICSPVIDFFGSPDATKARWSAMCGARWRCGVM